VVCRLSCKSKQCSLTPANHQKKNYHNNILFVCVVVWNGRDDLICIFIMYSIVCIFIFICCIYRIESICGYYPSMLYSIIYCVDGWIELNWIELNCIALLFDGDDDLMLLMVWCRYCMMLLLVGWVWEMNENEHVSVNVECEECK